MSQKPAAYEALDVVQQHAATPEDQAEVATIKSELDARRARALESLGGTALPRELHVGADGVVKTENFDQRHDGIGDDSGAVSNGSEVRK